MAAEPPLEPLAPVSELVLDPVDDRPDVLPRDVVDPAPDEPGKLELPVTSEPLVPAEPLVPLVPEEVPELPFELPLEPEELEELPCSLSDEEPCDPATCSSC